MKKADETGRIFNKLPVSASEFIRRVIKKMRYRKNGRKKPIPGLSEAEWLIINTYLDGHFDKVNEVNISLKI